MTTPDFLLGTWIYRSFLSNPDLDADFDTLEFGRGNIVRTIPHASGSGGVVAQWIAVKQG